MKSRPGLGILVILALLALVVWKLSSPSPDPAAPSAAKPRAGVTPAVPPVTPLGDQFLTAYGDPSTPPSEDLEKVGRVVEGIQNIMKNLDTRLIATNKLLSAFLTGNNREGMVYLSPDHLVFGNNGTLRDRWGTPLVVHPLGTGLIELRSAGPDKILYTEDDLIRDPRGGVFKPGEFRPPVQR